MGSLDAEERPKTPDYCSLQKQSTQRDFHAYQLSLFLITQLGYLPVAGSLLSTTFFEPPLDYCNRQHGPEFMSLLIEWKQHCEGSIWTIVVSSTVMLGAVGGAFISGFLADSLGRKPVVVGSMVFLAVGNATLAALGHLSPYLATVIFFLIGASCGGYMVTNLVLMLECLEHARSRLLVVSLNGWPLGMVYVGIVAWLTREWRNYHIIFACTSTILFIILQCISLESVRWLIHQNHLRRADKIQLQIDARNTRVNELLPKIMQSQDFERAKTPSLIQQSEQGSTSLTTMQDDGRKFTYLDLFRHGAIRRPLLALCYCFATSSMVSFGFYFSIEVLPGSRYLNLAAMGLLKFALGFLPFLVSFFLGRRPIILASVGVACVSIWTYLTLSLGFNLTKHWIITLLGLLITASIDPTWKINHLYSAELFPTTVRNMSRAVCNVGARIGSLAAPLIVYSRHWFTETPIIVFAVMLTIQWIVVYFVFAETKNRPLPDEIDDVEIKSPESTCDDEAVV